MLNKLSGLSSPPLPFTPLIILSSNDVEEDLEAIRAAAPRAVVRGGVDDPWTLANQNRVFVLDRCGRLVYQQSLQQSDTNLQSVQAAILSSHLDEPCGPCHLPSQQDDLRSFPHGRFDHVEENLSSQTKMSGIANAYASSSVAKPTHTQHKTIIAHSLAEETLHTTDETDSAETTGKPEHKTTKKKNKNKRKNGKHPKEKKRKRVYAEVFTSTSKPTDVIANECDCGINDPNIDARGCECVGQYIPTQVDRLDILVPSSPHTIDEDLAILNEILESREHTFQTSTDASTVPHSRIIWPMDKREKKQKNGKQNRMDLQHEINEGIEIVRHEEEEIVEYPETIDFFVQVEDNVVADTEQEDEDHLLGRGEHDFMPHGPNSEHSTMGNARDHLLGRGEHDFMPHGWNSEHGTLGNARDHLLGSGEHDFMAHGPNSEQSTMGNARDHLLGRGEHDFMPHGQNSEHSTMGSARDHLLGRGEHDFMPHGPNSEHGTMGNARDHLLGRGEHDFMPHGWNSEQSTMGNARDHLLGRGEHDFMPHGWNSDHGTMGNTRDHLLGRGEHDLVNHGLNREHDIVGNERQGRRRTDEKVFTEELEQTDVDDSFEVYLRDRAKEDKQQEREDKFRLESYDDDGEIKDVGEKKNKKGMKQEVPKKENKNKKTRVQSEEADNGAWVGSDEVAEFALRSPTEKPEGTVAVDTETAASRFATWREATIAPTTYDARSSGESEDQTRRVVMYESEGGDQSQSWDDWVEGKDALLHSKVQPWSKGKRY